MNLTTFPDVDSANVWADSAKKSGVAVELRDKTVLNSDDPEAVSIAMANAARAGQ